jgi:hypothetical protein
MDANGGRSTAFWYPHAPPAQRNRSTRTHEGQALHYQQELRTTYCICVRPCINSMPTHRRSRRRWARRTTSRRRRRTSRRACGGARRARRDGGGRRAPRGPRTRSETGPRSWWKPWPAPTTTGGAVECGAVEWSGVCCPRVAVVCAPELAHGVYLYAAERLVAGTRQRLIAQPLKLLR